MIIGSDLFLNAYKKYECNTVIATGSSTLLNDLVAFYAFNDNLNNSVNCEKGYIVDWRGAGGFNVSSALEQVSYVNGPDDSGRAIRFSMPENSYNPPQLVLPDYTRSAHVKQKFTLSYWLKVDEYNGNGRIYRDDLNDMLSIGFSGNGGTWSYYFEWNGSFITSFVGLPRYTWMHFAFTWETTGFFPSGTPSGPLKVYIDGDFYGSSTQGAVWYNVLNEPWYREELPSSQRWIRDSTGNINLTGIGFWDRALTSTEIVNLYNNGTGSFYPF